MKRKAACFLPVIIGTLFCFYYVRLAADNVAFTDYIRLINSYLPDVTNPEKFFVPDVLTRVPITYLGRIINVKLFGYNTLFDIGLSLISMGLGAAALAAYGLSERRVGMLWLLLSQFVYFSLNKWEMLCNGTGWVCFLSISGFMCHFVVLDRAVKTDCREKWIRGLLWALPPLLILLVAGPYCGGYAVILVLAYGALLIAEYRREGRWNRTYVYALLSVLISMGLYLWSSSQAVYVHRGAVAEGSILSEFLADPLFFVRFMLKALASSVAGVAQLQALEQKGGLFGNENAVYILGAAVALMYLFALYLTWRERICEKTVFPLLMILSGGCNHLLILAARWIFLNDEYGMSSRYELQYQMGIIGILLTFALAARLRREAAEAAAGNAAPAGSTAKKAAGRAFGVSGGLAVFFAVLILAGNLWTTRDEIRTAPYRKIYLQTSRELGLNYRTASDEDLEMYLHSDADDIRSAMEILEENNLNIFRDPNRK